MDTHQIIIIGGGTAGITVASRLLLKDKNLDIAIIDPAKDHFYQPAWTLVGAGTFDYEKTRRSMKSLIPNGVKLIAEEVTEMNPDANEITLKNGNKLSYQYLVVCPGIQIDLDGIEGLRDAIGKDGVCSNYIDSNYTWEVLQNFKGGNAVFTQPTTPIKCGGAPQKIMYLADEYWRKQGVRDKTDIIFATPGSVVFGVEPFKQTINNVIARKNIHTKFFYGITKIDATKKEVHFKMVNPDENGCVINEDKKLRERVEGGLTAVLPYDMLHLAPPQSAPDFVKKSKLAYAEGPNKGWVNVNINSLQHNVYKNVFGLGDVAALPTAKSGAAVRKQAPVVVENLMSLIKGKEVKDNSYTGYSSCPLVTGYSKMVLAEFGYDNVRMSDPLISKFVDTSKEKYSMWLLKKYGLPYMYWNKMLKGKA